MQKVSFKRDAELAAKASDYYKGGMLASYDPPASTPSDARVPWVQIPLWGQHNQLMLTTTTCSLPGFQNDPWKPLKHLPLSSLFALVIPFSYELVEKQLINVVDNHKQKVLIFLWGICF